MTRSQVQASAADAVGRHEPVLLERCLDLLAPAIEGAAGSAAAPGSAQPVMIDCTLGMGGHTEAALERFATLKVVGIDRDPEAIALASARLARFGDRFVAVQATYDAVSRVAHEHSVRAEGTVDAVLMDLGASSLQLDEASRGFSYARPAPLDMRMDQGSGMTAQDLLEHADAAELTRILRTYGEERFASRIAAAIVRRRESGDPVTSTQDLAELVRQSVPAPARRSGGHPAKRTFQALRIAVNAELDVLERAVPRALNSLRVGGRLVVESYQSLEDRIVKRALAHGATSRSFPRRTALTWSCSPAARRRPTPASSTTTPAQHRCDCGQPSACVRLTRPLRRRPLVPSAVEDGTPGAGAVNAPRVVATAARRPSPPQTPADRPRRSTIPLHHPPSTPVQLRTGKAH